MTTTPPAPAAVWAEGDILTWSDTREFTHPAPDRHGLRRVIVVQTVVCHDTDSGASMVGRCTYYIGCDTADDPIFSSRITTVIRQAVEVPLPCEVEAARVLTEFDPATLSWIDFGDDTPTFGPHDEWVALHWPEDDDIFARHHSN